MSEKYENHNANGKNVPKGNGTDCGNIKKRIHLPQ